MPEANSLYLLTVAQAAKEFPPSGVSIPTCWRWILRGCRGRRLESVLVGGRRYVSREAITRFLQRDGERIATPSSNSASREKAIAKAVAELSAMGL